MAASSSEDMADDDSARNIRRMLSDGSLAEAAERDPELKRVYEQFLDVCNMATRQAAEAGIPSGRSLHSSTFRLK